MPRRFRLNPCDYLFFAHHAMMQRCGQTGNLPFMILDLEGGPEPAALEAAVAEALRVHPVARSRARVSPISGRPSWEVVQRTDQPAVVAYDLRGDADWLATADRHCQENYAAGWDVHRSPQVRLELYRGPDGRSRLCLRWPHALMDAEGAQWFLSEVNRLACNPGSSLPRALRPDDETIDVLQGRGVLGRIGLFRHRMRGMKGERHFSMNGLASGKAEGGRWRFVHRGWAGADWELIRANAARACPDGPARFSRYLGACVLRALGRLFAERGMEVDAWQVTLPMRVRGVPSERPMPGNYLVSVGLYATRATASDRGALLTDLTRQIEAFHASRSDLANVAMVWLMSFFRAGQYRGLLTWALLKHQPYASGFSFYGEIDPPLRTFVGARVTNFWGAGSLSAPPGWNPVFSRFGERLNLGLSWLDGYYEAETARRYLELIDEEMRAEH